MGLIGKSHGEERKRETRVAGRGRMKTESGEI